MPCAAAAAPVISRSAAALMSGFISTERKQPGIVMLEDTEEGVSAPCLYGAAFRCMGVTAKYMRYATGMRCAGAAIPRASRAAMRRTSLCSLMMEAGLFRGNTVCTTTALLPDQRLSRKTDRQDKSGFSCSRKGLCPVQSGREHEGCRIFFFRPVDSRPFIFYN